MPSLDFFHPLSVTPASPSRAAKFFGLALAFAASGAQVFAQSTVTSFVPFDKFMANTRSVSASALMTDPDHKVRQASSVEEMRQSILNRYTGVKVTHSFVVGSMHYDCVPSSQQPAMRTYGLKKIAEAPPTELIAKQATPLGKNAQPAAQFDANNPFDEYGNSLSCEAGTVPLMRTTMDTLSRFASLKDFYSKTTSQQGAQTSGFAQPAVAAHKYSYTYQNVNNLGGNSNLNVWSPYVNTSLGEIFSLSQEWYVGGSGAGLQTEEVGWVVYPAMFGDERSHFFIFSTSDGYATGCWNNSCGDFVQVASSGLLGAHFSNYSTIGGTQYDFGAEYYLYNGNWWLAYQGTWVGYYPGSKYKGGQLTHYAQTIEYGTESVGTTIWPPEGSGRFSNQGFGYAAYQRNIFYISTAGPSYWSSLTAVQPSPAMYTISGPYSSSSSGWARYFYEGGPGGTHD